MTDTDKSPITRVEDKLPALPPQLNELTDRAVEFARTDPWKAFGIAVGAGFALRVVSKNVTTISPVAVAALAKSAGAGGWIEAGLAALGSEPAKEE